MISRIRGTLHAVTEHYALVENGGLYYEVLVPSALAERLRESGSLGKEVVLETIYFIEAGDRKANHYPKLLGFTDPVDREFFSLLIQVSGLGIKKALKSLVLPIRDIATAIETKDVGTLSRLPGIGGRLAEKIIAELHGKTAKFALAKKAEPLARKERLTVPFEDEAIEVLLQLQYSRREAEEMIKKALATHPKISGVEQLIALIFKNEQKSQPVGKG